MKFVISLTILNAFYPESSNEIQSAQFEETPAVSINECTTYKFKCLFLKLMKEIKKQCVNNLNVSVPISMADMKHFVLYSYFSTSDSFRRAFNAMVLPAFVALSIGPLVSAGKMHLLPI